MAFKHGIYPSERPTGIQAPVQVNSAMPVAFVTAPVHLSEDPYAQVNVPRLCFTYQEAVRAFGFNIRPEIWNAYTAPQFIHSFFVLYAVAPMVIVNVLDPHVHYTGGSVSLAFYGDSTLLTEDGTPVEGVLIDSIIIAGYTAGEDYTASFNRDGHVVISGIGGALSDGLSVDVRFKKLAPEKVDIYDIIGGYDMESDKNLGLEIIDDVFPRFRLVPGQILAPRFSSDPAVASIMDTKAGSINGHFSCIAHIDVPTVVENSNGEKTRLKYTDVPAWKNENNITSTRHIPCYPMLRLGNQIYDYSTQLAGLIARTDSENRGVPYNSPSNQSLNINGLCDANGDEIVLGTQKANFLNSQGIMTADNFTAGWVAWGNRTGAFPGNTDPKDAFIPIRRMFDWILNTIVLTHWSRISSPLTLRRIETIVDSINMWFNGLSQQEFILGGRIEIAGDNVETDLMNGQIAFDIHITPPPPLEAAKFRAEYDVAYLQALFR